jgi:hypothetical protein
LRTKSDGHLAIILFVAYHHSPYTVSPQPITPFLLPPTSPTPWAHTGIRFSGILPDLNRLPVSAFTEHTNTAPSQSNLS